MQKEIIDITSNFNNCIKAEQRDLDIFILRKLDTPRRTWSKGKLCQYELEYRWLNKNTGGVLGDEYTYWNKKEIDINKNLFDQLRLIS